jgi:hypothetical protein
MPLANSYQSVYTPTKKSAKICEICGQKKPIKNLPQITQIRADRVLLEALKQTLDISLSNDSRFYSLFLKLIEKYVFILFFIKI